MAKAQARFKIYEGENINQKVPLKTLTMADIKAGDSRYPVKKRIKDLQGKLTRLINLISGEAKELAKPFIHDRPECGFANAMRHLEKQYGNPHKLLASYRKEIKQMTKIKPGDAAAYRRLFNFLIKCQSLEYGSQNPLDTPDVICMISAKIPGYLQDRWNRNVQKIRKVQMREPGLIDLTNFIEDEMVLVNDPLFSRGFQAVGQYEEKPLKQQSRSTKYKFQTHVIKEAEDSVKKDKAKCPICDEHHDIEECQVFLSQTMEDRSKTLYKKKLCYGCLGNVSKEHNAKSCTNRRMCKVCSGRHPHSIAWFENSEI